MKLMNMYLYLLIYFFSLNVDPKLIVVCAGQ